VRHAQDGKPAREKLRVDGKSRSERKPAVQTEDAGVREVRRVERVWSQVQ
jgi:hypothetical protein